MSAEMDIYLYGDSLKKWREWVSSRKQKESLLSFALNVNKATIKVSMPLWIVARVFGALFMFLELITFGVLSAPLRILLWPIFALVIGSCSVWVKVPVTRPLLLLLIPISVIIAMILISLIPYEPDIRQTNYILCELWPLSKRRLEWIETYGNGKAPDKSGKVKK